MTDDEVSRLLRACECQKDEKRVALSRAILAVLVYAGLRRQELLDLSTGDVNLGEGALLVRAGKGSKARKVFVCRECIEALAEWYAVRPQSHLEALWIFGPECKMHEHGLVSLIETIKAIAGLKGNRAITPHALRHNRATRLMKNGANLGAISAFLGHSSLLTTRFTCIPTRKT